MAGQRLTDATLTQAGASARTNGNGKGPASWEARGTAAAAILLRTLVLPFTVVLHRTLEVLRRQAMPHLVGWGVGAVGVLAVLLAFATQAGSIR